ncbi:MAG: hypoxanthine phosphoribosyltransferase [Bacteroidetes bacterium]|nr:hypoxanthine phosphoribosyltransferase [Bacteroidota bacterium]
MQDEIQVHDKIFVPYLTQEEIESAVKKVAEKINSDYANECPLFIAILNGSFMFAAELFKHIRLSSEICFIKLASYKGTTSSGHVITSIGLDTDVISKHVIILEDILDTGRTLSRFLPQIEHQQPKSLKIAALLHKPEATVHEVPLDYNCFKIPNKFVIGYGLDYNGLGRNIPSVYQLKED